MKRTRALATLRRSWRLLHSFRFEQTAPAIFYGGLAEDTAALVDALLTHLAAWTAGGKEADAIARAA